MKKTTSGGRWQDNLLPLVLAVLVGGTMAAQAASPLKNRSQREASTPAATETAKPQIKWQPGELQPTKLALAEIPSRALEIYQDTARKFSAGDFSGWDLLGTTKPVKCQLDWRQLAGHGAVESAHGTSTKPGVSSGLNFADCCAGPMQMNVLRGPNGELSSADIFKIDANGDGFDVYSLEDAIPTGANHLCSRPSPAAPDNPYLLKESILSYNADWNYYNDVLNYAARYGRAEGAPVQLLDLAGIYYSGSAAFDITAGRIDPRVADLIQRMAKRFGFSVDVIHTGHCLNVNCGTNAPTLHASWAAIDVYAVDGEAVSNSSPASRRLLKWLYQHHAELGLNEIGTPFPDEEVGDAFFTDEHHDDHFHLGFED